MKALAAVVPLLVLLSGCGAPPEPAPEFDGQAAYDLVAGLVHDGPALRDRVPGSEGHAATATWLFDAMQVDGWSVSYENFSGETYLRHDAGAVKPYRDGPSCAEARQAIAGWTFRNLVAEWDGPGDRVVLLGAHWDQKAHATHDGSDPEAVVPGAGDGASGVGVLLQLMRHVSVGDLDPVADVRIVFFDGEDGFEDCHPLAGSIHHAAERADEVSAMLLLDMVGDPEARFILERGSLQAAPHLATLVWETGQGRMPGNMAPLAAGKVSHCSVLDDHIPFIEHGVPAVDLIDFGRDYDEDGMGFCAFPPWWHTTNDTMENVDAAMLGAVGDTVWTVLEDPDALGDLA